VDPNLNPMPSEAMTDMLKQAREHDPDLKVVAVVHGSPDRGIVLSMWVDGDDPDAESRGAALLTYALTAPPVED
jgi:hypothetical protein